MGSAPLPRMRIWARCAGAWPWGTASAAGPLGWPQPEPRTKPQAARMAAKRCLGVVGGLAVSSAPGVLPAHVRLGRLLMAVFRRLKPWCDKHGGTVTTAGTPRVSAILEAAAERFGAACLCVRGDRPWPPTPAARGCRRAPLTARSAPTRHVASPPPSASVGPTPPGLPARILSRGLLLSGSPGPSRHRPRVSGYAPRWPPPRAEPRGRRDDRATHHAYRGRHWGCHWPRP